MRIVFYSHTGQLGNGGAKSLLSLVSALSVKHSCLVITRDEGDLNKVLTDRNIPNQVLPYEWSSNFDNVINLKNVSKSYRQIRFWMRTFLFNKRAIKKHVFFLQSFNPEIIYTNTSVINIGVRVAKELKIPHIWHLREFQNIDSNLAPDFGWRYFKRILSKSDRIITNSGALKSFYGQYVDANKIKVVYNGIETGNLIQKAKNNSLYVFLMVGTLMNFKGHEQAILAAKKLLDKGYDFKINIVGSGPLEKHLSKLISKLNLQENVILYGQKSEVEHFYTAADCYLMCSSTEAFGRVTVEAMLHKLPVIGRIGLYSATNEIIRDNKDGLLYESMEELVAKMEYILQNKQLGVRMGEEGYNRALQNFSLDKSVENINQILMDVTNDKIYKKMG